MLKIIHIKSALCFLACLLVFSGPAFGGPARDKPLCGHTCGELVVIDSEVMDAGKIIDDLPGNAEVIFLNPGGDGVRELSQSLAARQNLDALRIIAHGKAGALVLGGTVLDRRSLREHGELLASWGRSLAPGGDILLYGCGLAATGEGKRLVQELAALTHRDVAASTNTTGGERGDWVLEYCSGAIQSPELSVEGYTAHSLSVITFPVYNNNFTENGHSFTVSGEGYVWYTDYRSADNCAINNTSYGTIAVTKTSGNAFQLNSLWLKAYWSGFSVRVKGWNGGTELHSKDVSLGTAYSEVTFNDWTGINKITVTGVSNGAFALDDIDYSVENGAPSDVALSSDCVADGAPVGASVGTLSTTDAEDPGGHVYTFAEGGADNAGFTLSGSELRTAFIADSGTKDSYSVKIRSTDTGGLWMEKTFAITVLEPATIWTGPKTTFTKAGYADWSEAENQDRITDDIWITRDEWGPLFNARTEAGTDWGYSPAGTEWAFGQAADWASLSFEPFVDWCEWDAPGVVGEDAVLHLIDQNIYLDIKILSWDSCDEGAGFSYERSTEAAAEPDADGDGTPDSLDNCPNDPDKIEPGSCGCGVPDTDTDADGTADCLDDDDDGDGMPDDWENGHGLNPLVDDAGGDLDGDGVSNIDEYNAGWNPEEPQVNQPVLVLPADESVSVTLTTWLETGPFSDPDPGDAHLKTRWQVSTAGDFSNPLLTVLDIESQRYLTAMNVPATVLEPETTYYWRVRFCDDAGGVSVWSETFSFTTLAAAESQDADGNGIPDVQENGTADMNGNDTPDAEEAGIMTVNTVVGDGQIGVEISTNVTSIDYLVSISPEDITDEEGKPVDLPLGLIAYQVQVASPGDTAEVVVYLSAPLSSEHSWYKYDLVNGWQDYAEHTVFSEDRTRVTLTLQDGGFGDIDGAVNGVIVDPAGGGFDGEGYNCFIRSAIRGWSPMAGR